MCTWTTHTLYTFKYIQYTHTLESKAFSAGPGHLSGALVALCLNVIIFTRSAPILSYATINWTGPDYGTNSPTINFTEFPIILFC